MLKRILLVVASATPLTTSFTFLLAMIFTKSDQPSMDLCARIAASSAERGVSSRVVTLPSGTVEVSMKLAGLEHAATIENDTRVSAASGCRAFWCVLAFIGST